MVPDAVARLTDAIATFCGMLDVAACTNKSLATICRGGAVKKLARWAAFLAAPTLVASRYGMNFEFVPEIERKYSDSILIGGLVKVCFAS